MFSIRDLEFDDPEDPTEFREARLPGVPHAGLLTTLAFLNRYPTSDSNLNRHRAGMIMRFFLATDIMARDARPQDVTSIAGDNPTSNDPRCVVCHAELDPIAGAFVSWDAQGRYRPDDVVWSPALRPPGFGDEVIPADQRKHGVQWLARRITEDPRFAQAAVRFVYQALMGRAPMARPTDPGEPAFEERLRLYQREAGFLVELAQLLRENRYDLKVVLPEIILSPFYRSKSLVGEPGEAAAEALSAVGTSQLLTPERLTDRIMATTGYPWRRHMADHDDLLDPERFLYFYGGIDSDDVTTRIHVPNGIMARIQERMAAEMGCVLAPRELGSHPLDRRLLILVEPSDEPEVGGQVDHDAVAAIRATLVHLHAHLLDEHLPEEHAEIDATYRLFLETWREGKAAVEAGVETDLLLDECQHRRDFWTDAALPPEERLVHDPSYTIRAWAAVLTYLMGDFRFLYE